MATKPLNIICYASASGGNTIVGETASKAIAGAYPGSKITIVNVDKMWPGSNITGFDFYESCHRKGWYGLVNLLTEIGKRLLSLNRVGFTETITKQIKELKPDIILSATPLVAPTLLEAAKESKIPVGIFSSDYDPTLYAFEWPDKTAVPHRLCVAYSCRELTSLINPLINPRNVTFTGYPVRPAFHKVYTDAEKAQFRTKHGLPVGKEIVPIQMGSLGGNITVDYVKNITTLHEKKKITKPIHYPVFCGRNPELVTELLAFAKAKGFKQSDIGKGQSSVHGSFESQDGSMSFSIIGFTSDIHEYMAVSTAMITKPGPASISEAICMDIPMLIAHTGGALPWEKAGIGLIDQYGLGKVLHKFSDLATQINTLTDPSSNKVLRAQIEQFKKTRSDQFFFNRNIVNMTKELLKEADDLRMKAPKTARKVTLPKRIITGFVSTMKHIYHLAVRLFKNIGLMFTYCLRKLVDFSFFHSFTNPRDKVALQRRREMIQKGGVPIEGIFSKVSNKPIDAMYIPSTSKNRTGNVVVYSAAKLYENLNPKNYAQLLESGADILLYNPSVNTIKAMSSDLKQLLQHLKQNKPAQKFALYGHCLSGHVAAAVASDLSSTFGKDAISLIVDRGYGDAYAVAMKMTFISALVKPYIQKNFNAHSDKKIQNFKGKALFISTVQGKDKMLHYSKTGNFSRELFKKWSENKDPKETEKCYIELPKTAGHWTQLDEKTNAKIHSFLKENGIVR